MILKHFFNTYYCKDYSEFVIRSCVVVRQVFDRALYGWLILKSSDSFRINMDNFKII